jgi:hypothetical protein
MILLISVSQVARIIGVSHWYLAYFKKKFSGGGGPMYTHVSECKNNKRK